MEDSAQILAEKLRLTRELSTLKPELEHLRAQSAHHTNVVAEKLSLERQLNAAEVELEAEKRARREAARRDDQGKQVEEDLRRLLKDAEKRLAIEKKERERQQSLTDTNHKHKADMDELNGKVRSLEQQVLAERSDRDRVVREAEVSKAEAQARIDILEQRLESLRAKLRAAQADRKPIKPSATQDDRASDVDRGAPLRKGSTQQRVGKKRSAHEMSIVDSPGSSPDAMDMKNRKAAKKRAAEQSLAGEKSLFSVTPFLSRNKTLSLDARAEEDEEDADTSHIPQHGHGGLDEPSGGLVSSHAAKEPTVNKERAVHGTDLKPKVDTQAQKGARPRGRPRKVLVEASPNIAISAPSPGKVKVTSEATREKSSEATKMPASILSTAGRVASRPEDGPLGAREVSEIQPREQQRFNGLDAESKKKKRRLATDVSKTIFDEPEPEVLTKVKRPVKTQLGGVGAAQGALKTKKIGLARSGFGGAHFSPLKKDRRGVGASFLA